MISLGYRTSAKPKGLSSVCSLLCMLAGLLLSNATNALDLYHYLESDKREAIPINIYEDSSATASIDDILKAQKSGLFRSAKKKDLQPGFSESAFWLRIEVYNSSEQALPFYFQVNDHLLGDVQLYVQSGRAPQTNITARPRIGMTQALARLAPHSSTVYPQKLKPREYQTYYLRIASQTIIGINVKFENELSLTQAEDQRKIFLMFYSGVVFSLVLYNFFLFLSIRDLPYLLYCLSMISLYSVWFGMSGWFAYATPTATWFLFGHINALMFICSFFTLSFARSFLKFKDYFPNLDQILKNYSILLFLGALWSLFQNTQILHLSGITLSFVTIIICFSMGVLSAAQGFSIARFYLVAWTCLLGALSYWILNGSKLVPNIHFDHFFEAGHMMELILMSFALAFRIRILKAQESKARSDALVTATRSESKQRYFAQMSHDLRTPMSGIIGMTELLQETKLDKHQKQYINVIYSSAHSLVNIVNDILDLSKIEAGKMTLEEVVIDLEKLMFEISSLCSPLLRDKETEVLNIIDPNLPPFIKGDPTRLRQIITNLLGNACKFTAQGQVVLKADLVELSADHLIARFEVKDTGIGISKEVQESLFDAYEQANSSTARQYGGTGLGLSIAKQLSEAMGGRIGVESEAGKGSTFWFTAKFGLANDTEAQDTQEDYGIDLKGKRLLVADDSPSFCQVTKEQAQSWGMHVDTAFTGEEAIARVIQSMDSKKPYDIVTLDRSMPGIDGIEAARNIRKITGNNGLALLLISVSHELLPAAQAQELAIQAQHIKPLGMKQLQEAFRNALSDTAEVNPDHKPINILVAEDSEVNQLVLKGIFRNIGIDASFVENGSQALEKVTQMHNELDLVFMDYYMPEVNGITAAKKIRAFEQENSLSPLPIVALSGQVTEEFHSDCIAAGMNDCLIKPYSQSAIADILKKYRQH